MISSNSLFQKNSLGFSYEHADVFVFFGNSTASLEKIKAAFSDLTFLRVKQTHSDLVVEASAKEILTEADAHYTSTSGQALLISTADCLPVMIYCHQTSRVAAVHAGWKGVANQIVLKTLGRLIETGSSQKKFTFWVGPHILQDSFEVDLDVLNLLLQAFYGVDHSEAFYFKNEKYYVNLSKIVESQMHFVLKANPSIIQLSTDTKTTSELHSFRRDKQNSGRNLSFIVLRPGALTKQTQ